MFVGMAIGPRSRRIAVVNYRFDYRFFHTDAMLDDNAQRFIYSI